MVEKKDSRLEGGSSFEITEISRDSVGSLKP
jgi:hypothetical protein